jgi:hypothetical protein
MQMSAYFVSVTFLEAMGRLSHDNESGHELMSITQKVSDINIPMNSSDKLQ